jgi:hypothetical protein
VRRRIRDVLVLRKNTSALEKVAMPSDHCSMCLFTMFEKTFIDF